MVQGAVDTVRLELAAQETPLAHHPHKVTMGVRVIILPLITVLVAVVALVQLAALGQVPLEALEALEPHQVFQGRLLLIPLVGLVAQLALLHKELALQIILGMVVVAV